MTEDSTLGSVSNGKGCMIVFDRVWRRWNNVTSNYEVLEVDFYNPKHLLVRNTYLLSKSPAVLMYSLLLTVVGLEHSPRSRPLQAQPRQLKQRTDWPHYCQLGEMLRVHKANTERDVRRIRRLVQILFQDIA